MNMIQKIFQDTQEYYEVLLCEVHYHKDFDLAVEIYITEDPEGYTVIEKKSGGRREAVWNKYLYEKSSFIKALTTVFTIDELVKANSYKDLDKILYKKELGDL